MRRRLADPTRRNLLVTNMNKPPQEGSRRQNGTAAGNYVSIRQNHSTQHTMANDNIFDGSFNNLQSLCVDDLGLHCIAIELAICLGPGAANGWSLAPVQHSELNPRSIGNPAHQAIQRIDLANKLALAKAADSWIAGHDADRVLAMRYQCCPGTHARRYGSRLTAGMATANHHNVKLHAHILYPVRLQPAHSRMSFAY